MYLVFVVCLCVEYRMLSSERSKTMSICMRSDETGHSLLDLHEDIRKVTDTEQSDSILRVLRLFIRRVCDVRDVLSVVDIDGKFRQGCCMRLQICFL